MDFPNLEEVSGDPYKMIKNRALLEEYIRRLMDDLSTELEPQKKIEIAQEKGNFKGNQYEVFCRIRKNENDVCHSPLKTGAEDESVQYQVNKYYNIVWKALKHLNT